LRGRVVYLEQTMDLTRVYRRLLHDLVFGIIIYDRIAAIHGAP
jgi:hypothetical protein